MCLSVKFNFKCYIQFRFKLGSAINEIFKELKIALPKGHLSLSTLTRWMNQFKREVSDLKDNHRKNMFTIFFRTSGVVNISYLEKRKTNERSDILKFG